MLRQSRAIRAAALEQVLVVLDEAPDTATVHEPRPAIEETADKETIKLLRRFLHPGQHLINW